MKRYLLERKQLYLRLLIREMRLKRRASLTKMGGNFMFKFSELASNFKRNHYLMVKTEKHDF
jgi:hypothetical protein